MSNPALPDVGGALRLGGTTTILNTSFIANSASSRGLAIAAVGFANISDSTFAHNTFYCETGEFVEDIPQVWRRVTPYVFPSLVEPQLFCAMYLAQTLFHCQHRETNALVHPKLGLNNITAPRSLVAANECPRSNVLHISFACSVAEVSPAHGPVSTSKKWQSSPPRPFRPPADAPVWFHEDVDTARYDTVCHGCPAFDECDSCTVKNVKIQPTCSVTLEHTDAEEEGTSLETLSVAKGYWRATNTSYNILSCYNPDACIGGRTGGNSYCDDGYRGACES